MELHGDGFRVLPPSAVTQDEVHTLRRYEPTVRRILIADDTSIAFRTAYYQRQMKVWAATGAFGVPFLAFPLPRVKIRPGLCAGCGIALADGRTWRCFLCDEALRLALGMRPESPDVMADFPNGSEERR